MKAILFYLFVAITATAIVLLSLGQSLTPALPEAQAGVEGKQGLTFGAGALAHYGPSPAHYTYVNQEWLTAPTGLQIATKRDVRMPRADTPGVQLRLTPAVGEKLAGKLLHVSVGVLPMIGGTTARELALSAQDGRPIEWVRKPITTESGMLQFDLPASNGPVRAIGFWPYADASDWSADLGVEITSVHISSR